MIKCEVQMCTFYLLYANSLDAFNPELWAQESLAILEENMVVGNLVHRDFSPIVAKYGDTVNTRQPAEFEAKRKIVTDDVTVQDATATNVAVKLDQLVHTSFLLRDGEESMSFKDLATEYLQPAMVAQARFVDMVLLGQYPQFLANSAGRLGQLSSTTSLNYILETRKVMNINKAWETGRNLIWTPSAEMAVLQTEAFYSAEKTGDEGTAMREASLGRKLGFNHYMCQNMASVPSDAIDTSGAGDGAINLAAGYPAGTTTMTINGFTQAITANSWITVAGDNTPLRVMSSVGGATPTAVTVAAPGLRRAVVHTAVVTNILPGTVNHPTAGTYAVGWSKVIGIDGFTNYPEVGQALTFGTTTTSEVYTIIAKSAAGAGDYLLDRPLVEAVADGAAVNPWPVGDYNMAFHRNAIALVIRPLAPPRTGVGALSAAVNYNGASMRATITYDGTKQGHLVTLDMLMGVKVLNSDLGSVLFG